MPDDRSLIEKLEAMAAADSGASENERRMALAALRRLHRIAAPRTETGRVLTRDSILAQDEDSRPKRPAVRVNIRGVWVTLDGEDWPVSEVKDMTEPA